MSVPTARGRRVDWLAVSAGTAVAIQWTALALVVAVVAIGVAPGSEVRLDIATSELTGLDGLGGTTTAVAVDPAARLLFRFTDPSFAVRMLNLATLVPGLLLIAEIARRMGRLLRAARRHDPFTASTVRHLTRIAAITAVGGLAAWAVAGVARWALSSHVLAGGTDVTLLDRSPLGWLGAALIMAGFAQVIARGVAMRAELDTVI